MSDTPKIMEGTPEVIYLQTGDAGDEDMTFDQLGDVTWADDWIDRGDTKYIRADVAERELSAARAEAERLREALRPKIMPSVGVAIGTRLRDFYRNRFALVNPVQHTDNERQVLLAALESLLSALAATRKDDSNG